MFLNKIMLVINKSDLEKNLHKLEPCYINKEVAIGDYSHQLLDDALYKMYAANPTDDEEEKEENEEELSIIEDIKNIKDAWFLYTDHVVQSEKSYTNEKGSIVLFPNETYQMHNETCINYRGSKLTISLEDRHLHTIYRDLTG